MSPKQIRTPVSPAPVDTLDAVLDGAIPALQPRELDAPWKHRIVLCDGAMGTMLHAAGVPLDRSLPELNATRPDLVRAIHAAYVAAGAAIIETNTFGASRYRLARHGLESRVTELNAAGAAVARLAAIDAGRSVLVAGSVSPATPPGYHGRISATQAQEAFHEQIQALADAGVDLLVLETFGSLAEMVQALGVAREVAPLLPIVALMTFVDDGRTVGGDSPREVATRLENLGVDVLGANCTLGPQGLLDILRELARYSHSPLAAQPNAGPPTMTDGHFRYTADVDYFARHARQFVEVGAVLVGGCCGTTPAHTEAMAEAIANLTPSRRPTRVPAIALRAPVNRDYPVVGQTSLEQRFATKRFVAACELAPQVGGDAEKAVQDAIRLGAAGCHVVVVAPAVSPRAHLAPASLSLLIQQRASIETILTATTWEKSVMALQADLLGAYAFGIRHVLCRTGTPPLQGDYPNVAGIWDVDSLGLMQILQGLNEGRDHNGIALARPTSFVIGARVNPSAESFSHEVETARRKLAAGATYLVTPPVFDLGALERLLEALSLPSQVRILVGILPLHNFRHAEYLQHEVPEMHVPPSVLRRMWDAGERGPEIGAQIALELVQTIRTGGVADGVVLSSVSDSADELVSLLNQMGTGD